jgi:hypothetical protein
MTKSNITAPRLSFTACLEYLYVPKAPGQVSGVPLRAGAAAGAAVGIGAGVVGWGGVGGVEAAGAVAGCTSLVGTGGCSSILKPLLAR